ncbi:MAG: hypothetical protein O3A47_04980 [Chloroflexi bacterium]|nr:hypothetical protein [Chloroflexota bacterium]
MATIAAPRPMKVPVQRLARPVLATAAVLAAVIVPVVLLLSGTGPGARIAEAYDVLAGLEAYRMSGTTISSMDGQTAEVSFEWDFAAPESYRGTISGSGETQEFIVIGGDQYSRTSANREARGFIEIVTDSIFTPVPSRAGTLRLLDSLMDLKELPDVSLEGLAARHYLGTVAIDRIMDEQGLTLDPASPGYAEDLAMLEVQRSIRIDVELWIDKGDSTIRQLKLDIESPVTGSGGKLLGTSAISTFVRYFGFNQTIEIGPPLTASGELDLGWQTSTGRPPEPTVEVSEK